MDMQAASVSMWAGSRSSHCKRVNWTSSHCSECTGVQVEELPLQTHGQAEGTAATQTDSPSTAKACASSFSPPSAIRLWTSWRQGPFLGQFVSPSALIFEYGCCSLQQLGNCQHRALGGPCQHGPPGQLLQLLHGKGHPCSLLLQKRIQQDRTAFLCTAARTRIVILWENNKPPSIFTWYQHV